MRWLDRADRLGFWVYAFARMPVEKRESQDKIANLQNYQREPTPDERPPQGTGGRVSPDRNNSRRDEHPNQEPRKIHSCPPRRRPRLPSTFYQQQLICYMRLSRGAAMKYPQRRIVPLIGLVSVFDADASGKTDPAFIPNAAAKGRL